MFTSNWCLNDSFLFLKEFILWHNKSKYQTVFAHSLNLIDIIALKILLFDFMRKWTENMLLNYVNSPELSDAYMHHSLMHICIIHQWLSYQIITCHLPIHYLNQFWFTFNFSEIYIRIKQFAYEKMNMKILIANWEPFCLSLNLLTHKHLETHGWILSTAASDALVLKQQVISIHSAD